MSLLKRIESARPAADGGPGPGSSDAQLVLLHAGDVGRRASLLLRRQDSQLTAPIDRTVGPSLRTLPLRGCPQLQRQLICNTPLLRRLL